MSTSPEHPSRCSERPPWLLWPERPLPAYAARLLAAVADTGPHAVPGGSVFCPDGLGVDPVPRRFGWAVVALPGDLAPIADLPHDDPLRRRLSTWIASGASLLVPTRTAVGLLVHEFGADRSHCHIAALPLPDTAVLPALTVAPADGYILVDRPIWSTLYPYLRALRLAGCRRHIVLVADDAAPPLAPGGDVAMADLVPGLEVSATLEREPAVAGAAVIVRVETSVDPGWRFRQCLASGRPLVVNGETVVQDHLEALGASAYLYSSLGRPLDAAEATLAALMRSRGPVHERARDAVLEESWHGVAELLVRLLRSRPATVPAPTVTSTVGMLANRPGIRVAVIAPPHRRGSAERFVREIVTEMARHPSRPAVTLFGDIRAMTSAARATEAALVASGGRAIDVGPEGIDEALLAHADEIDVIWSTWPHRTLPPRAIAPLVSTFHDLHWRFFWSFVPEAIREIEEQMPPWLEATTLFVSSSEYIRGQLCGEYLLPRERTRVVPLTGMRPLPVSRAAADAVKRRFCLPRHFLLFPASRSPHKNHVALERALELLRTAGKPMHVVTTSDLTEMWYHGPDMIGIGYVSDDTLRALYELSDGLVTPTLYEAGSFPVFEAMIVGRPVACSRIPPIVEQLERDGALAELFDPNDPADIAAALSRLRKMGPLKRARIVAHNKRAVGQRSWADVADGYLQVFGDAIAAAEAPAAAVAVGPH